MIKKIAKVEKKVVLKKIPSPIKIERYFEAVGRRKTAVARVRLFTSAAKKGIIKINNRELKDYFPVLRFEKKAIAPLEKMKAMDKLGVEAQVKGGGIMAQAEAILLGISRALLKFNPDFRKRLKRVGYLTRDSRMVERKKYGLKKARRAPQWTKR